MYAVVTPSGRPIETGYRKRSAAAAAAADLMAILGRPFEVRPMRGRR